jgi:hypothetical protein
MGRWAEDEGHLASGYISAHHIVAEMVIESVGAAINLNVDVGPSAAMFENFGRISGIGIHMSGMRMFQGMISMSVPTVEAVPRLETTAIVDAPEAAALL